MGWQSTILVYQTRTLAQQTSSCVGNPWFWFMKLEPWPRKHNRGLAVHRSGLSKQNHGSKKHDHGPTVHDSGLANQDHGQKNMIVDWQSMFLVYETTTMAEKT